MNVDKVKEMMVNIVEEHNHCTAVEVAVEVTSNLHSLDHSAKPHFDFDFYEIIEELIKEGRISGLEYIVPNFEHRVKLLLFPKGTKARLLAGDNMLETN